MRFELLALTLGLAACDERKATPIRAAPQRTAPAVTVDAAPPPDADFDKIAKEIETNIPVVDASLARLESDYRDNEVAADDKYKDQVLALHERVHRIAKEEDGTPFLELQVGDEHTFARAMFEENAPGLAGLKPGQRVSVHCFCQGFVKRRLVLIGCGLQETGRPTGSDSTPAPRHN